MRRNLGGLLKPLGLPPKVFVVTDPRVGALYGREVGEALSRAGFEPTPLTMPRGERAKNWSVIQRLAKELLAKGAHRGTGLVALGGGVVGDVTGFLASIYMRGMPLVQVPTTLLAMVTPASAAKPPSTSPKGKTSWGPSTSPAWSSSTRSFWPTSPPGSA